MAGVEAVSSSSNVTVRTSGSDGWTTVDDGATDNVTGGRRGFAVTGIAQRRAINPPAKKRVVQWGADVKCQAIVMWRCQRSLCPWRTSGVKLGCPTTLSCEEAADI
jgi:hypothetical protein